MSDKPKPGYKTQQFEIKPAPPKPPLRDDRPPDLPLNCGEVVVLELYNDALRRLWAPIGLGVREYDDLTAFNAGVENDKPTVAFVLRDGRFEKFMVEQAVRVLQREFSVVNFNQGRVVVSADGRQYVQTEFPNQL